MDVFKVFALDSLFPPRLWSRSPTFQLLIMVSMEAFKVFTQERVQQRVRSRSLTLQVLMVACTSKILVSHRFLKKLLGKRFKGVLALSGRLLLKILLMLVMLGLGLSVSGVLLFPCLPLLLRILSVFFDCGRAVRCMLPLRCGRFLHLVVLYGYQGADREAEKLALTDQLLDAAFRQLRVVAREQPCLVVGDFNVEPTKIPYLAKGISAGLWVDLEAAWAFASGRQPGVTCKRSWDSAGGSRRDFSVLLLQFQSVWFKRIGGFFLTWLFVRTLSIHDRYLKFHSRFCARLFGLPPGCLCILKVVGLSLRRFRGLGLFMTIGCSFMTRADAIGLDEALGDGDVSHAWSIWSSAAEAALADAYRFSGGPVPDGVLS